MKLLLTWFDRTHSLMSTISFKYGENEFHMLLEKKKKLCLSREKKKATFSLCEMDFMTYFC